MASTMSSAFVGQRVTVKAAAARKTRSVQVSAAVKEAKPKVLTKASDLRLLGKAVTAAEELGLIGLVESVGPSLSTIEKLGLLSKGEALQLVIGGASVAGFGAALAGSSLLKKLQA